jgi:hypothetical protein
MPARLPRHGAVRDLGLRHEASSRRVAGETAAFAAVVARCCAPWLPGVLGEGIDAEQQVSRIAPGLDVFTEGRVAESSGRRRAFERSCV